MADIVLIAALLLALAVVLAGLARRLRLPDSVMLVLAGMALAELARLLPGTSHFADLRLSPQLVFFVLLPVLVFESGLSLDARRLLKDLAPVLTLAVPALLLSTAIIGLGLWQLAGLAAGTAFLFAALISATDPVAVVALFREVGAPARLGVLVEGESLFNDAVAIVVFSLLLGLVLGDAGDALDAGALLLAVPEFALVFFGGAGLGICIGVLASELGHRLRCETPAMLALSVAAAYVSFIVAEHSLHVSGVMAAVTGSIAFGALGVTRMSRQTRQAVGQTWELLAFVCNALLFLLMGLAVEPGSVLSRWPLILAAVLLIHLARAVAVYGLLPATLRLFDLPAMPRAGQHIMWWGGLKGGLAVAIALSIPDSLPTRQLVLDVTMGVVLLSLLLNAATLRPLMHRLGLDRMNAGEQAEFSDALNAARTGIEANLDRWRSAGVMSSAVHHRLARSLAGELEAEASPAPGSVERAAHLGALRAESEALAGLFEEGVIDQYVFLELRDLLLRDRARAAGEPAPASGVFLPLEAAALRWLRQRDWAAGLLARYQRMRLSGHLQHNVAGIIMARAAHEALLAREDHDSAAVAGLLQVYQDRIARRQARLADTRREFPDFCERFERNSFRRAALTDALETVTQAVQHGQLGARAGAALRRRLEAGLARTGGPATASPDSPAPRELLARVPVLQGLSQDSLEALAEQARPLTFLAGDEIIGEGEHGDALYVISRGRVRVSQAGRQVAELGYGDLFGEAALLGAPLRNATVTAMDSCTLLRLTRPQVLSVAAQWPEVQARLQAVDAGRHQLA